MEAKSIFWQDKQKDWKYYFDEGKSYLNTCNKLLVKRRHFDNEFIYNLSVLAGERLALGMLLSYNYIPAATSLSGMLQEGKEYYMLSEEIMQGARFLNKFQTFCSLEVIPFTPPSDKELEDIVNYIGQIGQFCENNLNKSVA